MPELKLNKHPINQLCRELLVKEKQQPDPQILHALQLLQWGLQKVELGGPWKDHRSAMLEQADLMTEWEPQRVHQILCDGMTLSQMKGKELTQIAVLLAENLHGRVCNKLPALKL